MKNTIKNIIAEITEKDINTITMDLELVNDLDIDSMMSLEILTDLEREFNIIISDEDSANFIKVDDIYHFVKGKIHE